MILDEFCFGVTQADVPACFEILRGKALWSASMTDLIENGNIIVDVKYINIEITIINHGANPSTHELNLYNNNVLIGCHKHFIEPNVENMFVFNDVELQSGETTNFSARIE